MPAAIITLTFDPIVELGGLALRLDTIALAGAILVAVGAAAVTVQRRRASSQAAGDLLFLVLGAIPGAIAGGRLGYTLLHLDYYVDRPSAILDPSQGALELSLAVVGGLLAGVLVSGLLGGPIRRWLETAAAPLLLGLGLGKLAMALGGSGQGNPADIGWATAYLGPGPWASLAPEVPSHPSQVYEGLLALAVLAVLLALRRSPWFAVRDGRGFFVAIGLWALARSAAATTWRDAAVVGPFNAAQIIALGVAAVAALAIVAIVARGRRGYRVPEAEDEHTPAGAPGAAGREVRSGHDPGR